MKVYSLKLIALGIALSTPLYGIETSIYKEAPLFLAPRSDVKKSGAKIPVAHQKVLTLLSNLNGIFQEIDERDPLLPPFHWSSWDDLENLLEHLAATVEVGPFFRDLYFFRRKLPEFFTLYQKQKCVENFLRLIGWPKESLPKNEIRSWLASPLPSELSNQAQSLKFYNGLKLGYAGSLSQIGREFYGEHWGRRFELFIAFMSPSRYEYLMKQFDDKPALFLVKSFPHYVKRVDQFESQFYTPISQYLKLRKRFPLTDSIVIPIAHSLLRNVNRSEWLKVLIYAWFEISPREAFLYFDQLISALRRIDDRFETVLREQATGEDFVDKKWLKFENGKKVFEEIEKLIQFWVDRISSQLFNPTVYSSRWRGYRPSAKLPPLQFPVKKDKQNPLKIALQASSISSSL